MQSIEEQKSRFRAVESMWFVVFASVLTALLYFTAVTWEKVRFEAKQRNQLVTMTDSFVSVFAEHRGTGAPVPATFRRLGLESFSQVASGPDARVPLTVTVLGTPGQEIQTVATDPLALDMLARFIGDPQHEAVNTHRILNNRIIAETFVPSVATTQSCVDCHNATLGADIYEVGDTMGAMVVQSDLTGAVGYAIMKSAVAFCLAFTAFLALAKIERRRSKRLMANVRTRVALEQQKLQAERQARFLMSHDPLTGLANRSMYLEELDDALGQDLDLPIVALVDLDEFKSVNDTLGHLAGDALLTDVAQRLDTLAEDRGGIVARLGGDEFALLIRGQNEPSTVNKIGEDILERMRPQSTFAGNDMRPSCSIGICDVALLDSPSTSAAMKAADDALYEAKAGGRNRYRVYDEEIQLAVQRRQRIIDALDGDLEKSGLRTVLQPQIDLKTARVSGFEALARLRLDNEDVSPAEFIPVAEETGKIDRIDLFVLEQSTRAIAQVNHERQTNLTLSANMSSSTLQNPALTEAVGDILFATSLPADRLVLEVTETLAVKDWDNVQKVFSLLRRMGVQAALDDFGTGYSSLSYLQSFGFDELKIDKSFTDSVANDAETRFLVGSIIAMTKGLGCRVVVEGIETVQQQNILISEGAQIGQGFLYSRPLEVSDLSEFLDRNASEAQVA